MTVKDRSATLKAVHLMDVNLIARSDGRIHLCYPHLGPDSTETGK